jgi:hypothetical protein
MKLGEKGWLGEYLEYRIAHYKEKKAAISRHPDFSLYNLLQPTGILYGNPVQSEHLEKGSLDHLEKRTRIKIVLAESLINSSLLFHKDKIDSRKDFSEQLSSAIAFIIDFYNKVYPEISTSHKPLIGRAKSDLEVAEKILEKRVDLKPPSHNNFWIGFFSTTLIFLDIYFFGQWIHTATDKIVTEFFREEKEELRLSVIKVIVAAAHANHIIEIEERKLFDYILHSADLSSKRSKEALGLLENGILVEEITLPENNSWLLKKYFLEIAILTVSADRVVDEKEQEFLRNFTKHLGFFEEDLENSMIALEGFIIENWSEMGELQNRKNIDQLSKEYENRLAHLLTKHAKKLNFELSKNEAAIRLIQKHRDGDISPEDNQRLQIMLIDILQNLPAFSSLKLPESFLTTENLFKILPEIYSKEP